ncbi:MAG: Gfo/Idh/MocA family oxidoreductase [Pseudomonadota bacterium]
MQTHVRWGILGTGVIAHQIAGDMTHAPTARLAAVASRDGAKAQAFANRFGAARSHDSYQALVDDPDVDAVYIATPNHLHCAHALMAIAAGKAVLVEKPFALNTDEARQIADAARTAGVFCMEAMWTRFLPAIVAVRKAVEAGEIGRPTLIRAAMGFPSDPDPANRFNDPALGGGALLDLGVYGVSLSHLFLGGAPDTVAAKAVMGPGGADRQVTAVLGYPGAVAEVTASLSAELSNTLEIAGDRGRIMIEAPFLQAMRTRTHRFAPRPHTPPGPDNPVKAALKRTGLWPLARGAARALLGRDGQSAAHSFPGNGYQFELDEIARCLAAGLTESPGMTLDDSVAVMETLARIRTEI